MHTMKDIKTGLNEENSEFGDAGEEPGEIDFTNSKSKPPNEKFKKRTEIPNSAKVVSSDLPEPWEDLDTPSDTH